MAEQKENTKNVKSKLTVKQKKLVKCLCEGKTLRESSRIAGLNECYACDILKKPKIKEAFTEIMEKAGLTDKALAEKIYSLTNATETKFFSDKGVVTDQREVEALSIQADMTKFATKVKGHVIDRSQIEAPGIEEILEAIRTKRSGGNGNAF